MQVKRQLSEVNFIQIADYLKDQEVTDYYVQGQTPDRLRIQQKNNTQNSRKDKLKSGQQQIKSQNSSPPKNNYNSNKTFSLLKQNQLKQNNQSSSNIFQHPPETYPTNNNQSTSINNNSGFFVQKLNNSSNKQLSDIIPKQQNTQEIHTKQKTKAKSDMKSPKFINNSNEALLKDKQKTLEAEVTGAQSSTNIMLEKLKKRKLTQTNSSNIAQTNNSLQNQNLSINNKSNSQIQNNYFVSTNTNSSINNGNLYNISKMNKSQHSFANLIQTQVVANSPTNQDYSYTPQMKQQKSQSQGNIQYSLINSNSSGNPGNNAQTSLSTNNTNSNSSQGNIPTTQQLTNNKISHHRKTTSSITPQTIVKSINQSHQSQFQPQQPPQINKENLFIDLKKTNNPGSLAQVSSNFQLYNSQTSKDQTGGGINLKKLFKNNKSSGHQDKNIHPNSVSGALLPESLSSQRNKQDRTNNKPVDQEDDQCADKTHEEISQISLSNNVTPTNSATNYNKILFQDQQGLCQKLKDLEKKVQEENYLQKLIEVLDQVVQKEHKSTSTQLSNPIHQLKKCLEIYHIESATRFKSFKSLLIKNQQLKQSLEQYQCDLLALQDYVKKITAEKTQLQKMIQEQMKSTLPSKHPKVDKTVQFPENNHKKTNTTQEDNIPPEQENALLKEYIVEQEKKMQQFSDKESKMIKLLLAIKKRGVDIDRIYNHDILNEEDDSSDIEKGIPDNLKRVKNEEYRKQILIPLQSSYPAEADDSVINDSDESSFGFLGRQSSCENSILKLEYVKNYDKRIAINGKNLDNATKQKLTLNLQEIKNIQQMQLQQIEEQEKQQQQQKLKNQPQKPTNNLKDLKPQPKNNPSQQNWGNNQIEKNFQENFHKNFDQVNFPQSDIKIVDERLINPQYSEESQFKMEPEDFEQLMERLDKFSDHNKSF